jgi:hypothetical protein
MITGTCCHNAASALHRLPPIADALPYAATACLLRLRVIAESGLPSSPSRIGAMSSADSSAGCRHRTPLRPVKSPSQLSFPERHRGMPRFPPSRLVRRLPAWRHHVIARLRVRAGIAQPLYAWIRGDFLDGRCSLIAMAEGCVEAGRSLRGGRRDAMARCPRPGVFRGRCAKPDNPSSRELVVKHSVNAPARSVQPCSPNSCQS